MAFFQRRVRNHAEAEDLTQEVLFRLLGHAGGPAQRDSYIFQVAQNLLVDRARKRIVRDRHSQEVGADENHGIDFLHPATIAEGREELACFQAAVMKLPERRRTIFLLYRVERIGQAAIAERFGISPSAVKQHVAKAMAFLMQEMREFRS